MNPASSFARVKSPRASYRAVKIPVEGVWLLNIPDVPECKRSDQLFVCRPVVLAVRIVNHEPCEVCGRKETSASGFSNGIGFEK